MAWLMARGGLRVGEVLALKRSDVDLSLRMLHIGASMSRREGMRPAKNDSERTIPLAADLTHRLREHLDRAVASIDGWLFVSPKGHRVRYGNWRKDVGTRSPSWPTLAKSVPMTCDTQRPLDCS